MNPYEFPPFAVHSARHVNGAPPPAFTKRGSNSTGVPDAADMGSVVRLRTGEGYEARVREYHDVSAVCSAVLGPQALYVVVAGTSVSE